jgi:hypothetical protein
MRWLWQDLHLSAGAFSAVYARQLTGAVPNLVAARCGALFVGRGSAEVQNTGTELLVNRLIDLGKLFDFMTYPDRTHGIYEGPGTTVHLYHLPNISGQAHSEPHSIYTARSGSRPCTEEMRFEEANPIAPEGRT